MFLLLAFFLTFTLVYLIIHPFILSKFSKILKIGDFTFKSIVNINFLLVVIQLSVFLTFTLVNFNIRVHKICKYKLHHVETYVYYLNSQYLQIYIYVYGDTIYIYSH